MESLLYSIAGPPIHPFLVHFAVVILPLSAMSLIAIVYMPKIKSKYSFITVVGVVIGSGSAFVAKQSGEALGERIGTPAIHADYGSLLTFLAFVTMVLSIVWYQSAKGRRSRTSTWLSHTTALACVGVMALTFLTGHSGAVSVWEGRLPVNTVASKSNESAKASATPTSTKKASGVKTYASADLKKHATKSSCWSVVSGSVYDLTRWIASHPGGQSATLSMCGRDATSSFKGQHSSESDPRQKLARYKIGNYA